MSNDQQLRMLPPRPRMVRSGSGSLRLNAPAKINLNLLVGARREDGYHGLDSYVAQVSLYDVIELRRLDVTDIEFTCSGADCGRDEENLAMKAASLMAERFGGAGVEIKLQKNIPPGKGLGGGSSDAAAVIRGLNELWRLGLSNGQMQELAQRLGSDVPLFLGPPTVRMTGRGEILQPIRLSDFVAILFLPEASCSTPAVYRAFDERAEHMLPQVDPAVLEGPPSRWRSQMRNQLAPAAMRVCPELLSQAKELAAAAGSIPVQLSGSGSAMFVLCDDAAEADRLWRRIPPKLRANCVAAGPAEG